MFWYKLWWGKNALASWVFQQAKEELAVRSRRLVPGHQGADVGFTSGEVLDDQILGNQAGMEAISGYQYTRKGRMQMAQPGTKEGKTTDISADQT